MTDGDYLETLRRSSFVSYAHGVVTTPADLAGDASGRPHAHPITRLAGGDHRDQLIDFALQAVAGGGWAVFLFHGVGGDYLQVSDAAHRQLLAWLKAHRREVWVTTLQNAIDWARAHPQPAVR